MLVSKITGWVIQVFDTAQRKFIKQQFIADTECCYEEYETGNSVSHKLLEVDGEEGYLPYDMVQRLNERKQSTFLMKGHRLWALAQLH
jgi:hypothetical protein